jgi:hypothetical protein
LWNWVIAQRSSSSTITIVIRARLTPCIGPVGAVMVECTSATTTPGPTLRAVSTWRSTVLPA